MKSKINILCGLLLVSTFVGLKSEDDTHFYEGPRKNLIDTLATTVKGFGEKGKGTIKRVVDRAKGILNNANNTASDLGKEGTFDNESLFNKSFNMTDVDSSDVTNTDSFEVFNNKDDILPNETKPGVSEVVFDKVEKFLEEIKKNCIHAYQSVGNGVCQAPNFLYENRFYIATGVAVAAISAALYIKFLRVRAMIRKKNAERKKKKSEKEILLSGAENCGQFDGEVQL